MVTEKSVTFTFSLLKITVQHNTDGIYALITAGKSYIESIYRKGSEKYKQVTKLQFRKRW